VCCCWSGHHTTGSWAVYCRIPDRCLTWVAGGHTVVVAGGWLLPSSDPDLRLLDKIIEEERSMVKGSVLRDLSSEDPGTERYVALFEEGDVLRIVTAEELAEAFYNAAHYDEPGYLPSSVWYWTREGLESQVRKARLSVEAGAWTTDDRERTHRLITIKVLSSGNEVLDQASYVEDGDM